MRHAKLTLTTFCTIAICASSLAQSLSYTTIVRAWVDGTFDEHYVVNDPGLQIAAVNGTTGNAEARARIAPGVNSTFAHWDSLNENSPSMSLIADAQTYWTDEVLISDPILNGTIGTFTASLRVFGNANFNLTGVYANGDPFSDAWVYGFWDSWIGTSTDGGGSFLVGGWFGDWHSDEFGQVHYFGDELNQPLTEVTLEFIYGQPFLLRTNMESYFDAQNLQSSPGTVEGTLDFSHTAYWNGIGAFYDAAGNLTNPSYQSRSGIDWRYAVVPEPTGLTALLLGLPALLFAPKRRSKSR